MRLSSRAMSSAASQSAAFLFIAAVGDGTLPRSGVLIVPFDCPVRLARNAAGGTRLPSTLDRAASPLVGAASSPAPPRRF